jgi:hypothetical protein
MFVVHMMGCCLVGELIKNDKLEAGAEIAGVCAAPGGLRDDGRLGGGSRCRPAQCDHGDAPPKLGVLLRHQHCKCASKKYILYERA